MLQPLVSIVLTSYNQPALLQKAFDSLLAQTYKNIEIIIVDDCSTDSASRQLIQKLQHTYPQIIQAYFQQTNVGIPANKNKGFKLAKGDFITYLDGDDTYYPEKIAGELEILLKDSSVGVVYSNFDIKNTNNEVITVWAKNFSLMQGEIFGEILQHHFPDARTHRYEMFRKEVLYNCNFYDEQFSVYHDLDFMLRYSLKYNVAYNDYIGSSYCYNIASIVTNTKGMALLNQQEDVYKKYKKDAKRLGLQKAFNRRMQTLRLNKLFFLDKPYIGAFMKAIIDCPGNIVQIAKAANFILKKQKTNITA